MSSGGESLEDALALRRLAELYALGVDTNDGDLFAAQFAGDGVLEAPRGRFAGREALRGVPAMMRKRYDRTFHAVFNQAATVTGDEARAQTYCIARHFYRDATGHPVCYEMTIRYQDHFIRSEAGWRFARRALIVDGAHRFALEPDAP